MNQQRFGRIANAQPLALRVDHNRFGHRQIGRRIDIDMAVAAEMLDHGHSRLGRYPTDQPFAAARNGQVDEFGHP